MAARIAEILNLCVGEALGLGLALFLKVVAPLGVVTVETVLHVDLCSRAAGVVHAPGVHSRDSGDYHHEEDNPDYVNDGRDDGGT